jgi:aminoglycoside phosphotransferase (APT) family kinase protein
VTELTRMLGGASRETWSFRLDGRPLVLRRDPPGAPRHGGMPVEAALLRAAHAAGVPVPEVVASGDDYVVVTWVEGEAIARRILRDEQYAQARAGLVLQVADAAARVHRIDPSKIVGLPADDDLVAAQQSLLDRLGEPHPAIELGLRWLAAHRGEPTGRALVHGDFRLGNWLVDGSGLVAVLDWELAHVGDPAEDLGWMCVRSWRFGSPLPVAGTGPRHELLTAYRDAGGAAIEETTLHWWEVYGNLRWAVICIQQAAAHLSGAVRSIELAAIGRRVCEVELDLLELLDGPVDPGPDPSPEPVGGPHDRPTASELVEAVREWVGGLPLDGRDAFLARVVARVLGTVERELALGPPLAAAHRERLRRLGMTSDAELAASIRAGDDTAEIRQVVRELVVDKLRVADPDQLHNR